MKNKKSSILMISAWVLTILVLFALSLGHRLGITLRLVNLTKNNLKAYYLAKAGINRAILELYKDTNNYDTLSEPWADNEKMFARIVLSNNENEFATVSYLDQDNETKYGITDEESRININTADSRLLNQLFVSQEIENAQELSGAVFNWIHPQSSRQETVVKNEALKTPEELLLVLAYFYGGNKPIIYEVYGKVKNLITVYAGKSVNINTASAEVLTILAGYADPTPQDKTDVEALVNDIISKRAAQTGGGFDVLPEQLGTDGNLWNNLKQYLTVSSQYFRIKVQGNVADTAKNITAICARPKASEKKRIVYWHEN